MIRVHPHVTVTIDGQAFPITGGDVALDTAAVPYATADVIVPLPAERVLEDLDPREDRRVTISGGNTGAWVLIPPTYTAWVTVATNEALNPSFEVEVPAGAESSPDWFVAGSRSLYVPFPIVATPWGVVPDTVDGIHPLIPDGGDLLGSVDDGIFTLPAGTRFTETAEPGIYEWSP